MVPQQRLPRPFDLLQPAPRSWHLICLPRPSRSALTSPPGLFRKLTGPPDVQQVIRGL